MSRRLLCRSNFHFKKANFLSIPLLCPFSFSLIKKRLAPHLSLIEKQWNQTRLNEMRDCLSGIEGRTNSASGSEFFSIYWMEWTAKLKRPAPRSGSEANINLFGLIVAERWFGWRPAIKLVCLPQRNEMKLWVIGRRPLSAEDIHSIKDKSFISLLLLWLIYENEKKTSCGIKLID